MYFAVQKIVEAKPSNLTEELTCESCGSFDAQAIGDRHLCADCVTLAGASCAGSRPDAGC